MRGAIQFGALSIFHISLRTIIQYYLFQLRLMVIYTYDSLNIQRSLAYYVDYENLPASRYLLLLICGSVQPAQAHNRRHITLLRHVGNS